MDSVMEMILRQQQQKIKIEVFGKLLQEKFDTRRIGMIGAARYLKGVPRKAQ